MNKIAVAVFVKTPGYSPLKTRLAESIGKADAEEFHIRATRCLRDVLLRARTILSEYDVELTPYWAVAEQEAFNNPLWDDFPRLEQGTGMLGDRLHLVYQNLIECHNGAILLGADSPQITPKRIREACVLLHRKEPPFCIGPARDGGFYLFGGTRTVPRQVWTGIGYSTESTCAELIEKLTTIDRIEMLPELTDVDTLGELEKIIDPLSKKRMLDSQRELARWIGHRLPQKK